MVALIIGSSDRGFRQALRLQLEQAPELHVLEDAGDPVRLKGLANVWRPDVMVLDALLVKEWPELLNQLTGGTSPARILLYAEDLTAPHVLAAIEHGVHGCLLRDADLGTWTRALRAIHAGECWIPRWLMAEAIEDLRQLLPAGLPTSLNLDRLTERQQEIVRWVAQGLSNKEIGRRMGISPTTVKTHLQNISERIGVSGRQRIGMHAARHPAAA